MTKLYEYLDEANYFVYANTGRLGELNLERTGLVCFFSLLMYSITTAVAYATLPQFGVHAVYFVPIAVFGVLWRVEYLLKKGGKTEFTFVRKFAAAGHFFLLASLACVEFFARKEQTSVIFAVCLVAFSTFYIDYFYIIVIYKTVCTVLFLIADYMMKNDSVFVKDRLLVTASLVLSLFCSFLILCIQTEAGRDSRVLKEKSTEDSLTGLLNKATFESMVREHLNKKGGKGCALIIFDFDNFKKVNDNYGHQTGDEVLKSFAFLLQETFRQTDYVGRVGGDEFMVFLKDMQHEGASESPCERILYDLRRMRVGKAGGFSASIGIAEADEETGFEELYRRADASLYQAKENGKAQYVRYKKDAAQ